ncbi:hypothetical protein C8J56DRAFT_1168456 [Mycena floridula]|nr:hypothetical protein C8J56DRAFT_1168456 [Mycena floridula]
MAAEADSGMLMLEKEVQRLQETILRLRMEQLDLLKLGNRYRNLASTSMRRVPIETWMEILGFVCVEDDDRQNSAVAIAGVCKQWREIALASPRFWNFFVVSLRDGYLTSREFIELHVARSQSIGLDIRFVLPDESDICYDCYELDHLIWIEDPQLADGPSHCAQSLLGFVMQFSNRISHLRFFGIYIDLGNWIKALSRSSFNPYHPGRQGFPQLESLHIGCSERHIDWSSRVDLRLFEASHNLRQLTIEMYGGSSELLPSSNWSQLTNVILHEVDIRFVHHLLVNCSSITHATVFPTDNTGSLSAPVRGVALSLISLEISASKGGAAVVQLVEMPCLEKLRISNSLHSFREELNLSHLLKFISGAPPRDVSLHSIQVRDHKTWENIFLSLSNTSVLGFYGADFNLPKEVLRRFVHSDDNEMVFLPQLTELNLSCTEQRLEGLLDMIASRLTPSTDYSVFVKASIRVKESLQPRSEPFKPFDPEVDARIKELVARGLDLRVEKTWKL